jgi:ribose 1,5-bisphosphate isomerase
MGRQDPLDDGLDPQLAAQEIQSMRIRGAAKIGRTAAAALGRLARDAPLSGLRDLLRETAGHLVQARPTAVTLRNAVNLTLDGLKEEDPQALQEATTRRARKFIEESLAATQEIARRAVDHLPPGSVVLTHCHSSLAVACLVEAYKAHGDLKVYADETRPWWQGHISTRLLAEAGVPVTLQVDSAARYVMETRGVDRVFVGADAVMADGSLYNKIGTHQVALTARDQGIPLFVACETHKFSPYSLNGEFPVVEERDVTEVLPEPIPGVQVLNPVFDRTPPDLIERYITQEGDMAPSSIGDWLVAHHGDLKGWI